MKKTNLLYIMLTLTAISIGVAYSLRTKIHNINTIQNEKSITSENIKKNLLDSKTGEIVVNGETPALEELATNAVLSGFTGENSGNEQVSVPVIKETIKDSIEQERKNSELILSGSFCLIGSPDAEKKIFLNAFDYHNLGFIKEYSSVVGTIEYIQYCFNDVNVDMETFEIIKKWSIVVKDKKELYGIIGPILKKSIQGGIYKISFVKDFAGGTLNQYRGCLNGDIEQTQQILRKYTSTNIFDIEGFKKYNVSCKFPFIEEQYSFFKNIDIYKVYSDLFKDGKMYKENYKSWGFESPNLQGGIKELFERVDKRDYALFNKSNNENKNLLLQLFSEIFKNKEFEKTIIL